MSRIVSENWLWLATIVDVMLAVTVTVHAVLWKRDSRAVISWVGLAWLAPLLGALAYFCLGVNRIQRKATVLRHREIKRQHGRNLSAQSESCSLASLTDRLPNLAGLIVLGNKLTGQSLVAGNKVQPLINGDEAYPLMLDSIRGARRSVALLSYIFDHDRAGCQFFDALLGAQKRGVEVRVLVDDVGSKYSRPNVVREMRKVGLRAASFLPTRKLWWLKHINLRNHRKILVVDGQIGFTGGTNIREGHWLSLAPAFPVQCLHFLLEGPVVAHLQETFVIDLYWLSVNWKFAFGA